MQTVQRLHCVAPVNQHLDRSELRTVVDGAGGGGKSVTTEIAPQAFCDVWIQFRSSVGVFTDFMRTTGIVTDRQGTGHARTKFTAAQLEPFAGATVSIRWVLKSTGAIAHTTACTAVTID